MFAVHVSLDVRPGAEAEFLAAMAENAAASLADEPGCLRFEIVRDDAEPSRFWLDERYVDADAFAAHRHTPHFRRWQAAADEWLGSRRTTRTGRTAASPGDGDAVVVRATDAHVVDRGGGVRTIHLTPPDRRAPGFLNGITEFAPGAGLPLHWHNCEESVVVVEGAATATVGGTDHALGPGDAIRVPAELPHRFFNPSAGRARILWTYARGDATRTLAESGETYIVGQEPRQDA